MHRRSLLLGLFASVSVVATMSAAAAAETLAARASGLADHDLVEFGDQFFGFFGFRRGRRRRWGRRGGGRRFARRPGRRGGGGGGAPVEAAAPSGGGGGGSTILTTSKPVPLSDRPIPPRTGAPANR